MRAAAMPPAAMAAKRAVESGFVRFLRGEGLRSLPDLLDVLDLGGLGLRLGRLGCRRGPGSRLNLHEEGVEQLLGDGLVDVRRFVDHGRRGVLRRGSGHLEEVIQEGVDLRLRRGVAYRDPAGAARGGIRGVDGPANLTLNAFAHGQFHSKDQTRFNKRIVLGSRGETIWARSLNRARFEGTPSAPVRASEESPDEIRKGTVGENVSKWPRAPGPAPGVTWRGTVEGKG